MDSHADRVVIEKIAFSGWGKRDDTMPEYIEEEDDLTDEDEQEEQQPRKHPSQPIEQQADGTWILGRGADRWIPSENQLGDMRWLVERDLRDELGVPPVYAQDEEKIEFHKRQLALLDLAKQAPRCEHVFTDGRCCKAPRVKKGKLCYAHTLMEEKRPVELNLPPLEDANAVMLWLMDVLRGLAEGRTTEKTAGIMLYGLQLAMVNARFTTFQDVNFDEMVRTVKKPQRTQRNTKKEDFTARGARGAKAAKKEELQAVTAEVAENAEKEKRAETPTSERSELPQRTQRSAEEEAGQDFTAKGAEVANKEEQRGLVTATPRSGEKALPQRAQGNRPDRAESPISPSSPRSEEKDQSLSLRSAEEEASEDLTAKDTEIAKEEKPEAGMALRVEDRLEPRNAEGNPGVESAKSIFFGVEPGEGVADNRPASPPPEPPRKSSQSEVLMIPKDVEHHLRR
jgi:hypothetical protein